MTDLHCHLLPYVDDGAHDLEEAEALLVAEAAQGVTQICLTPHLRKGMFETPDETIRKQYERLKGIAAAKDLNLYLSREYHWDSLFREKLHAGEVIPMGKNVLLTEFSSAHSAEQILEAADEIRKHRYVPLIAHVERYPITDVEFIKRLRSAGALIQVNADAALGYDGRSTKKIVWALLKAELVDVIASDAHGTIDRPPRMKECFARLTKKLGGEPAKKLMYRKPMEIIMGTKT